MGADAAGRTAQLGPASLAGAAAARDGPQPLSAEAGTAAATLQRLGEALTARGYTEAGIVGATGAESIDAVAAGEAGAGPEGTGDPVDLLVRLFLAGRACALAAFRHALPEPGVEALAAAGVVEVRRGRVSSRLRIMPFDGLLIASTPEAVGDAGVAPDHVMGVGTSSITLSRLTIRRPVRRALDLGCGGGVQALLAARHSERVLAVDRNPRAVALTRLNARLNGAAGVAAAVADFLEPVRGAAFDLVVCNPPFVVSPDTRYLYRDGGLPGDGLCRLLVGSAPLRLREGGYCQVLCNWAHVEGEPWQERIASWCAGTGCDAWAVQLEVSDPRSYAGTWVGTTEHGTPEELTRTMSRWLRWMEAERIEAVGTGLVTLRRRGAGMPWFRADEGPDVVDGPAGEQVLRVFAARDLLDAHRDDEALLGVRLRLVADAEREVRSIAGAGGWQPVATRLALGGGLRVTAHVHPAVAEVAGRCDGTRTLAEALSGIVEAGATGAALAAVRRLVERGFLAPA